MDTDENFFCKCTLTVHSLFELLSLTLPIVEKQGERVRDRGERVRESEREREEREKGGLME